MDPVALLILAAVFGFIAIVGVVSLLSRAQIIVVQPQAQAPPANGEQGGTAIAGMLLVLFMLVLFVAVR
jgi:hypothetical protein